MTIALKINALKKTYAGGVIALRGIDLHVRHGDFFALLGPNGAGKSTVIGIISSLVNKSSGQVSIYDHDIDEAFSAAKSCLGLVPQEFNFNMFEKVEQIIVNQAGYYGIDRKLAYQRTEFYLKKLGLWDKRQATARSLSGGMKRRLMIARALVHQPKLLILDEPTAGVDIEIRRSMWDFLRMINEQGTTVILTTHYLEEAELLCRNIAIIDKGSIVVDTTIRDLLARMNHETFVLDLRQPLAIAPSFDNARTLLVDATTLEVEIDKKTGISSVFGELSRRNIDVVSMRNKANRLEQMFVNLVENNKTQGEQ